ncbi:MAG: DUF2617 family protein [Planctomycetaceae bacterium]|nr:DUF2617 family protein [Planctomycetaceae bacterium]MCB9953708.1 DUF2617 family protein [Planctomycetaceae bacterium]
MTVQTVRPSIQQLSVGYYDFPLHPELFNTTERGCLRGAEFELHLAIDVSGHVLRFSSDAGTFSEVVAAMESDVSLSRPALKRQPLRLGHEIKLNISGELAYCFTGHLEVLSAGQFAELDVEFRSEACRAALCWMPSSANRLESSPVSLIKTTCNANAVQVHAFHTFPRECAILRTQSLFEFRPAGN